MTIVAPAPVRPWREKGAHLPIDRPPVHSARMSSAVPAACDQNRAAVQADGATPHAAAVLAATILASSLAFIDGSVVNVALPAIGHSLGAAGGTGAAGGPGASGAGEQTAGLQWVINAYLLPLSALLLIGGGAGDRFGRRRLLVGGIGVFALASLLCAAAPSLPWLLAGRTLQGIGAAALMPNSLAILGASFSGPDRGKAIGTWASVGAIAGAVGPLLGGWLVDLVGWRTIFLINLPIAAGAIWLAVRYVGESTDDSGTPLDWAGGVLATAGLLALTWGLTIRSAAHADGRGTVALVAAVVLLAAFVAVEWRKGDRAMMPVSLFTSKSFVGLTLLTLMLYGALGGLLLLLPYLLIRAAGYSAFAAGAALLPLPAVIGVMSRVMGRVAATIGPRLPLTVGPLVVGGGFVLAARMGVGGSYWTSVFPALLVIALGMAGAVAPLTTAVLSSVDAKHTGTASGFNSAVARSGGMIATALLGSALAVQGDALVGAFHAAAWVAAGLAAASGVAAAVLVAPLKAQKAGS